MSEIIHLSATDIYSYFRPSQCEARPYLIEQGVEPSLISPYEEVLMDLGNRHERSHLATMPDLIDLSAVDPNTREKSTIDTVTNGGPGVYQARFRCSVRIGEYDCEVAGEPDFLIRAFDSYIIRDSKMSHRINAKDHPEIVLQLNLYGWLFEQVLKMAPAGLQVHSGVGEIVELPYEGEQGILEELERIIYLKTSENEPIKAVGWTKCSNCGFKNHCWEHAWENHDVATLVGVDQGLAFKLADSGITTYSQLLDSYDSNALSELKRPWGSGEKRVGKGAERILLTAECVLDGKTHLLQKPDLPKFNNWVMFDLEGMPPYLDLPARIYLWGMQVFGENPGQFLHAASGFGKDGDKKAWFEFLKLCENVFSTYGNIRFIHWASYEKTALKKYIEKYGDPDGVGGQVLANLLDLLRLVERSVILPLPSYSLKEVEKSVGYQRSQDEYGGTWAMANFIRATETDDQDLREQVMNMIVKYNQEDLEATWAVFEWFRGLEKRDMPY